MINLYFREYLSRLFFRALHLAEQRKATVNAINGLALDIAADATDRNISDHYDEKAERNTWVNYSRQYGRDNEVTFRAALVRDKVNGLIANGNYKNVVNWGAAYGRMEYDIALANPDVSVWGIDRRDVTTRRNREAFSATNVNYETVWDILEWQSGAFRESIFCHINIGTYFLPKFLSKLYSHVHEQGARAIIAFEPSGVSRQTMRYFDYSTEARNTVVFRGPMLLNNYPNLLVEAGFQDVSFEVVEPPHPQPDFRSVLVIAKKDQ